MKKKIIVTVGREYGSGGMEIASKLAERLEIAFYDKNIVNLVAEESGISPERLAQEDEKAMSPFVEPYAPYGIDPGSLGERVFRMESRILEEKANEESLVIIGRCSDILFAGRENTCHVFIFAPMDKRVDRIMEREGITDRHWAEKLLKRVDKARKSYYQYYTDCKWGSTEGKDLLINSASTGIEGAVELIIKYLKDKGFLDEE